MYKILLLHVLFAVMPGKTKKKTPNTKRLYQPYSKENLQLALEAVTEKKMSQREASQTYGVPQPTISDYVCCNQGISDRKLGCKPVFSPQVEAQMVTAASDAAQMGLGLSRYQFMAKAGNLACQMNITTPWKTAPGPKWLRGVQKQN